MTITKFIATAGLVLFTSTFAMFIYAADPDCPGTFTGSITPPIGNELKLTLHAKGIQIYDCKESLITPRTYSWVFRSPVATLSKHGKAAIHYAGPRWKSIMPGDNSTIKGAKCQDISSLTPNAIPQLLLSATHVTPGPLFGNVTYIQRVNTTGGVAPVAPVAPAASVCGLGAELDVPYTADYKLYRAED